MLYNFSLLSIAGTIGQKRNVSEGFPIPQFSFAADGLSSSSVVIPATSQQVKVSADDLQMLLHNALDGENEDYVESGSGSGSGNEMVIIPNKSVNYYFFNTRLLKSFEPLSHKTVHLTEYKACCFVSHGSGISYLQAGV